MLKNSLFILSCIFAFTISNAQIADRVMIEGTITVPPGDDPEGITVYNETSQKGTISNSEGEFRIAVALHDRVTFSALQFQEFTVIVDQGIVDTKSLNVAINEAITELDQVVISPLDLTGNVEVDVARIAVAIPDVPRMTAAEAMFEYKIRPDSLSHPRNAAFYSSQTRLNHGLNIANIFKAMVRADEGENDRPNADIDRYVRQMYEDDFFKEHLNIERKYINDFIYYASDNGLNERMLEEGNELELIEFLVEQSKEYKQEIRGGN